MEPKIIAASVGIYRAMLRLYPASHRRDFGDSMAQLFRDQCRDAWQAGGNKSVAQLWLRVLPDLAKTSIVEQINSMERNSIMKYLKNSPTLFLIVGLALAFLSFSPLVMPFHGPFMLLLIASSLANLAKAGAEFRRPAHDWPMILLRTFVLMFFYALFMPAWAKMKLHAGLSSGLHDNFEFFILACLMANPLVTAIKILQLFIEKRKG